MRSLPSLPLLAVLAALAGCSSYAVVGNMDTADREDTTDTTEPQDSDDEVPTVPAQYWSLDGTVAVAGGALDVANSRLLVDLWLDGTSVCGAVPPPDTGADTAATTDTGDTDDDGDTSIDLPHPTSPGLALSVTQAPPSDLTTYAWWDLDLTEGPVPCDQALPATHIGLGIGPMDPRLYGALDADGYEDPEATGATLYSAFVRAGGDDVWVFGVAGTAEQYAGTGTVATAAPLPDGTYEVRSLYLLPMP